LDQSIADLKRRAVALRASGSALDVARVADQIAELTPDDPTAQFNAIRAWRTAKDIDSAARAAMRAIANAPLSPRGRNEAIDALVEGKYWQEAAAIALTLRTDDAVDHRIIGLALKALRATGQVDAARALAGKSLAYASDKKYERLFSDPLQYMQAYYATSEGSVTLPYIMSAPPACLSNGVFETDRKGYRYTQLPDGSRFSPADDPQKIGNAAIIGNSTGFGVGASSDSGTLASLLSTGGRYRYYNIGVRNWSLAQSLTALVLDLRDLPIPPRLVLFAGWIEFSSGFFCEYLPANYNTYLGWNRVHRSLNRTIDYYPFEDWPESASAHFLSPGMSEAARVEAIAAQMDKAIHAYARLAAAYGSELIFVLQPIADLIERAPPAAERAFLAEIHNIPRDDNLLARYILNHAGRYAALLLQSCARHGARCQRHSCQIPRPRRMAVLPSCPFDRCRTSRARPRPGKRTARRPHSSAITSGGYRFHSGRFSRTRRPVDTA
jgi:hypothetical protein